MAQQLHYFPSCFDRHRCSEWVLNRQTMPGGSVRSGQNRLLYYESSAIHRGFFAVDQSGVSVLI
jgi:hypothetical protein